MRGWLIGIVMQFLLGVFSPGTGKDLEWSLPGRERVGWRSRNKGWHAWILAFAKLVPKSYGNRQNMSHQCSSTSGTPAVLQWKTSKGLERPGKMENLRLSTSSMADPTQHFTRGGCQHSAYAIGLGWQSDWLYFPAWNIISHRSLSIQPYKKTPDFQWIPQCFSGNFLLETSQRQRANWQHHYLGNQGIVNSCLKVKLCLLGWPYDLWTSLSDMSNKDAGIYSWILPFCSMEKF